MSRKFSALLLAMLLLVQCAALAEAEFSAAVAAGRTFAVYAAFGGKVTEVLAAEGDVLEADGALLKMSGEKIYAPVDGTASAVYVAEILKKLCLLLQLWSSFIHILLFTMIFLVWIMMICEEVNLLLILNSVKPMLYLQVMHFLLTLSQPLLPLM